MRQLLRLLEDKNGEVQNLAVRWYVLLEFSSNILANVKYVPLILAYVLFIVIFSNLANVKKCVLLIFSLGPLVNKVQDVQVAAIVDSLCANMVGDKVIES